MRTLPLAVVGSLVLLAGCGDARPDAAIQAGATAAPMLPVDLLGTWAAPDGSGFIALGTRQVVVAVEGAPRAAEAPVDSTLEPGMSAGRIRLADGTVLFLARGSSSIQGLPIDHLDIEIVGSDGRSTRRRLLAETGLRLAMRLPPPPPAAVTAAPVATAVAPAPVTAPEPVRPAAATAPAADPDTAFLAAVPAAQRPIAEQCIARARAGDPAAVLATEFGNRQRLSYAAVLTLLEQTRSLPPAEAADRLAEADRRRTDAEAFAQAWRRWMAGRG